MNEYSIKKRFLFIAIFSVMASLLLFIAPAHATIIIEGDKEFKKTINHCLDTYRNSPGKLGDVIKELEDSKNEHRIVSGKHVPGMSVTPNNGANARNGKGTGTVTKANESYYKWLRKSTKILKEELKYKDFCTAIWHELWHVVDADRGEWSQDRVDDVLRDEIEAVRFQNLVHTIRGVKPRTSFVHDISKHLGLSNNSDDSNSSGSDEDKVSDSGEGTKNPPIKKPAGKIVILDADTYEEYTDVIPKGAKLHLVLERKGAVKSMPVWFKYFGNGRRELGKVVIDGDPRVVSSGPNRISRDFGKVPSGKAGILEASSGDNIIARLFLDPVARGLKIRR